MADDQALIEKARSWAEHAHAPYSGFHVGCALISTRGKLYGGANVEAAQPEGLLCAERNAIQRGIAAEGAAFQIKAAAISCMKNFQGRPYLPDLSLRSPCGACRQVLHEFCEPDTRILIDDDKSGEAFPIARFLPDGFLFGERKTAAPDIPQQPSASAKDDELIAYAQAASALSYAGLSKIHEACVVIDTKGDMHLGVQIDNSSTGLSISAFRGAMNSMVLTNGADTKAHRIIIARSSPQNEPQRPLLYFASPILLHEFATDETQITVQQGSYAPQHAKISQILGF